MPEFADKWKVNDSWCKTLHYEGGNSDFVELHHIDSFARICELEGLNTIAEVCDKYPSLIPLFSEKQFEIEIEELYTISKARLISSYQGLFPTGFDDHLHSLIASYAVEHQKFTNEAVQKACHDDMDSIPAYTFDVYEESHDNSKCFLSNGYIEGVEDYLIENYSGYSIKLPLFPCIHMPIKEFFNEVSNHTMEYLGENYFFDLWEDILITNYEVMRKLLQSLLQAMGFLSVEEAEKKYPFIISEGIENFLDRLVRNFDEAITPLKSELAYWRQVQEGKIDEEYMQESSSAIVWYTNHIEMLHRFSTDRATL